jgi:chromosomal replication initiation ATPase DnaA
MPRQLTFDLPSRPALGRDDFFVSPANTLAVAMIDGWESWPERKLALVGAAGSGKTHLAHVWSAESSGSVLSAKGLCGQDIAGLAAGGARVAVEDVHQIAGEIAEEQALFHLHNLLLAEGGALLLTSTTPPNRWSLSLPDLASRMQGTNVAHLTLPDDELLKAVLMKLFADRQLAVAPPVLDYLVTRMERSFGGAQNVVRRLDQAALVQRRPITRAMVAAILDIGTERPA